MGPIRTIKLREQQSSSHQLSRPELSYLLGAGQDGPGSLLTVTVRDPSTGTYDLRPGSIVGTLVWPGLQVLIRPKVNLDNIFFLLGFRGGLVRWGDEAFPYLQDRNFLVVLAWAFAAELERALRHGVGRDYMTFEDALSTVRGRMDIARQLRIRQDRAVPMQCRFQEYTEDIELNRVIKAAIARLTATPGLDLSVSRRLRIASSAFDGVAEVEYGPNAVPEIVFTRLNQQWEPATRLAKLILSQESLKDETGTTVGTAFTVDMNKVFEKFLEEVVREEALKAHLQLEGQASVKLSDKVRMAPDLVIRDGSTKLAVGDAKYIETEPSDWPNANLYQLLAYCVSLRLPRGLLIYATSRPLEVQRVPSAGIDLEAIGIDLEAPRAQLLDQARRAARRLVDHADAQANKLAKSAA